MTDLFLRVLNLSYSAVWVVLAVVLARLVLKKAPRRLICLLWALVALRLVFGGIEAPFSLVPSTELIPPESLFEQSPAIHSGISSLDNAVNPIYAESLRPTPGASVNPLQVWLAVFSNLWVLGMVAMCAWALLSCRRVRKQIRESIPDGAVWLCDRISSPFIFGLFRPKIYLPSDLPESARTHVIAHEQAHLRRRDHWWKPLGFGLLTVNWFNPTLWLAYILLCRDIELACDERVIQRFTVQEKKAYSAALLRCSINSRRITACPLAFGEVGVKQRIKSVLHYKKSAFWIILLALLLTVILAAGLLTDPQSAPAEIRYQGNLYIQNGQPVEIVPDKQQSSDTLRSVLHDSTPHPNENNQAVGLGWEYPGQPLVQVGNALYLQEPGGKGWLPFVQLHSPGNVQALLQQSVQIDLTLEGDTVSIREFVRDFTTREDLLRLGEILAAAEPRMVPSLDWDQRMLAINYAENISMVISPRERNAQCLLTRRETDWLMVYRDEEWAVTAWTFESPELDELLTPWKNELAYSAELFAPFATTEAPIYLMYQTLTVDELALRVGIPTSSFGSDYTANHWEWEGHGSYTDKTMTIRCRPAGREDWMEIRYFDSDAPSVEPNTIEILQLHTTRNELKITAPTEPDWTETEYQMAVTIAKTISLTDNGRSLFSTAFSTTYESPLGISLHLENITPGGATLICTQDGTPWDQIITGSPWNLEQRTDEGWIPLMPESTVWTAIAYGVNLNAETRFALNWNQIIGSLAPGHYRVSKTFLGDRKPPFTLTPMGETTEQTCYAEFDIDGTDLSAEPDDGFSQALHQALRDSWTAYDSMPPMMQLAFSTLPGSCIRDFDRWDDLEQFLGVRISNPLEKLEHLEKGNWAAMPEGYNGASRFHVTFQGTREGQVKKLQVASGYRRDEIRVGVRAEIYAQSPEGGSEPVITSDSGDDYEARTATLVCGSIQYSIRVMGEPGTGNSLNTLLQELLPYFEELPTA